MKQNIYNLIFVCINIDITSNLASSNRLRDVVNILPASLNALSDDTDVACMHRYLCTILDNCGYSLLCISHHSWISVVILISNRNEYLLISCSIGDLFLLVVDRR